MPDPQLPRERPAVERLTAERSGLRFVVLASPGCCCCTCCSCCCVHSAGGVIGSAMASRPASGATVEQAAAVRGAVGIYWATLAAVALSTAGLAVAIAGREYLGWGLLGAVASAPVQQLVASAIAVVIASARHPGQGGAAVGAIGKITVGGLIGAAVGTFIGLALLVAVFVGVGV